MEDLPQGVEQRLVLRLLGVWREACGFERFPSYDRMAAARVDDIWSHGFVIDLGGPGGEPVFRELGPDYGAHSPRTLVGRPVSEAPRTTLIGQSLCCLDEVVRREVPVSRGGRFRCDDGTEVLFRTILLPLSEDGRTVNALFGAANCRVFAVEQPELVHSAS